MKVVRNVTKLLVLVTFKRNLHIISLTDITRTNNFVTILRPEVDFYRCSVIVLLPEFLFTYDTFTISFRCAVISKPISSMYSALISRLCLKAEGTE